MDNRTGDPGPMGPEREYFAALAAGRFQVQRCATCKEAVFYPRCVCPHCGADRLDWFAPSGGAVVYTTTVVRRKAEQGGDYNVCLVDLDEGVRMMTQVVAVPPAEVCIGMRVRARIDGDGDQPRIVFAPAEAAA